MHGNNTRINGTNTDMTHETRKSAAKTAAKKKPRVDWDAVERDYRTGKFTLRELAAKYGCSHQAINLQAKKNGWTQDLSLAIKQATNALLVDELVAKEVDKTGQALASTVLVAAEVNKRVILGHRQDLSDTRKVAASLLIELNQAAMLDEESELLAQILAGSGASPLDEAKARAAVQKAVNLHSRIGGIKSLAETFAKIQASERIAFGLPFDGVGSDKPEENPLSKLLDLVNGSKLPLAGAQ
jgi:hypothetical protein